MREQERLSEEIGDAEMECTLQSCAVLDKLERVRVAVMAVQNGEPGAAGRLANLCEERYYGGLLPDVRCEKIVAAARARDEAVARLAELGDEDDVCELKA